MEKGVCDIKVVREEVRHKVSKMKAGGWVDDGRRRNRFSNSHRKSSKGKGHTVPKLKYFPGSASGEQRNVGNLTFLSRHIIPTKHVLQPLVLLPHTPTPSFAKLYDLTKIAFCIEWLRLHTMQRSTHKGRRSLCCLSPSAIIIKYLSNKGSVFTRGNGGSEVCHTAS